MKDVVLFIGYFVPAEIISREIKDYFKDSIKIALLYDKDKKSQKTAEAARCSDMVYEVDFASGEAEAKVEVLGDRILAATTRGETFIENYSQLASVLQKYTNVPSAKALLTAASKIETRRALMKYFPEVSVNFLEFKLSTPNGEMIDSVNAKLTYPVIVKPAGLSTSMLVSRADNDNKLKNILEMTKTKINEIYEIRKGRGEPQLIIEEFISGQLYSVDVYIDKDGSSLFCPPVKTITGVRAGKSDYYGYLQICPAQLTNTQRSNMQEAVRKVVKAVGLSSTTAHVELIFSGSEWKIVEIGPRSGGFRTQMYRLSHDIPHNINDLLIKFAPHKIELGNFKRYSALVKIYEDKEGIIKQISGLEEIKSTEGVALVTQNLRKGEAFTFARNGGLSIFDIVVHAESEEKLINNVKKLESKLKIKIG